VDGPSLDMAWAAGVKGWFGGRAHFSRSLRKSGFPLPTYSCCWRLVSRGAESA